MTESGAASDGGLQSRERLGILLIFLAALALRLAAVFFLGNFNEVTGFENEEVARNLLAGRGWSMSHFGLLGPTAFMYPLYTIFLYLHFLLFGINFMPVEVSQAVIGSLGSVLLFFIGARLFDARAGGLAAVGSAFYPTYVYWCTRGQALIIEVFLLELMVLIWLLAMERRKAIWYILFGAVLGVSGLSKTLYLAFFPLFLFWYWLWLKAGTRDLVKAALIPGIAAAFVISPWTARNYIVFHRFIPVTLNSGYILWAGNNPSATGNIFTEDRRHISEAMPDEMREKLAGIDEFEKDELFRREAVRYIRENPGRFFGLMPRKLYYLWWFSPYLPTDFPGFREVVYVALLLPALFGMLLSRRQFRKLSIFYLIYIELSVIYSIYLAETRFRYVIEFSFILFAAAAGIWVYDRQIKPRLRSLAR